jgi:hypothetical protein
MRLVDLALYNALIMMRVHHPKASFIQFRLNIVRKMLEETGGISAPKNNPLTDAPLRLTERHFVSKCPPTPTEKASFRRCFVCSKKKKNTRTAYWCGKCEIALCVVPCFEVFHTKQNL